METILGLYRILIGVSAAILLIGLILLSRVLAYQENFKKHLYILGVVNLLSMLTFLFDISISSLPGWKEAIIFLETSIITLNLLMAYYVYKSIHSSSSQFAGQIKQLFFFTFLSICFYVTAFFIFGGDRRLLQKTNGSFNIVIGISSALFMIGSLYPMIRSILDYLRVDVRNKELRLLLILNGVNNTIGLFFYLLSFPNAEIALMLNIVSNLLFAYYLSYYFLSVYFDLRKKILYEKEKGYHPYSWKELRSKLTYWEEVKDYLYPFYPDLIDKTDQLNLSKLEKTHFVLKQLNIKAKDIADAFNVSVKAVEMSRYRIRKKLEE